MKYREFGRTGLEVSELVFGGGAVGGLLVNADDDTKLEALRGAVLTRFYVQPWRALDGDKLYTATDV